MKSLCTTSEQKVHLEKLQSLITARTLTGTQAWTAFSVPEKNKKFGTGDDKSITIAFSSDEVNTYKALRQATQQKLFLDYGHTCSYCRRPVGHYGFSWHIEHVLPKSLYRSHTFDLENLTVGCVDCNRWKGARVDKKIQNKVLPIINPVEKNFEYSKHLRFLQIGTENLSFAKYTGISPAGKKTYDLLSFEELERVHAINSVDPMVALLHDRLTKAMSAGLDVSDGKNLLDLLGELKTSIYRRP